MRPFERRSIPGARCIVARMRPVVVFLLLSVLAACTQADDGRPPYADLVDAACAQTQRALAAIPPPTSNADIDAYLTASARENAAGIAKLEAISPPAEAAEAHADLVKAARDAVTGFEDVVRAQGTSDGAAETAATERLAAARERYNAAASAVGAVRCLAPAAQPSTS